MSVILNTLRDSLSHIDVNISICIAYSGGIDSSVLLHASHVVCKQTGHSLKVIHIDHQLHEDSQQWSQHCIEQCRLFDIQIETICVDLKPFDHHGVEGAAREARYQAFETVLNKDDVLFTAHHADDQIETVLLQLFRGSGVNGLAGCAQTREIGDALLVRPLLKISRQDIEHYAEQHKLQWLDDPSNHSLVHDRNYLRHEVMPLLHARWPGLRETMARSSQWQGESSDMLAELAELDVADVLESDNSLKLESLRKFDNARLKNILREWIKLTGRRVPSADVLDSIIRDAIHSRNDSESCVRWQNNEVRKFRQWIYLQDVNPPHDETLIYQWNINHPLVIPSLELELTHEKLVQFGVNLNNIDELTVRFRQGGEVMRPRGRGCQKALKTLFQEQGVKPWERDRIPLLFHQHQLIFVWGYWIGEGY
ncbi:MAG: tRNA lysidine(34) synthetase TilS [Gammaproteobacteria bacterium]